MALRLTGYAQYRDWDREVPMGGSFFHRSLARSHISTRQALQEGGPRRIPLQPMSLRQDEG
eukprot:2023621-Rhodomonas_salina.1